MANETFDDAWSKFIADCPQDLAPTFLASIKAAYYVGALEVLQLQRRIAMTPQEPSAATKSLIELPLKIAATLAADGVIFKARNARETAR